MSIIKKFDVYVWITLLVILEQLTKIAVIAKIKPNSITVINGILKFSYCENDGVAFSFGSGHVPLLIILNIVMLLGLIAFYERNRKEISKIQKVFFAMVISGGSSNLLDRITRGYVVDFIDIGELFKFAIFNVADIFLVIGIFGFCIVIFLKGMKK